MGREGGVFSLSQSNSFGCLARPLNSGAGGGRPAGMKGGVSSQEMLCAETHTSPSFQLL